MSKFNPNKHVVAHLKGGRFDGKLAIVRAGETIFHVPYSIKHSFVSSEEIPAVPTNFKLEMYKRHHQMEFRVAFCYVRHLISKQFIMFPDEIIDDMLKRDSYIFSMVHYEYYCQNDNPI